MINQTQIGPIIVSSRKKRLTSAAGINLGAMVTKTKGIATHKIHINGTIKRSLPTNAKLSIKNNAQEFFKTLFIKIEVIIRDVLLNQVLIVTSLRIFEF